MKEREVKKGRNRKPKVKVQLFSTCWEQGQPLNLLGEFLSALASRMSGGGLHQPQMQIEQVEMVTGI